MSFSWASHLMEVPPHLSQSLMPCANSLPFRHPLIYHQGCQLSLSGSPSVCPRPITLGEATVALLPSHAGRYRCLVLVVPLTKCLTLYLKPMLLRLLLLEAAPLPQALLTLMLLQGRFLCYSNPLSPFENMSLGHFIRLSAVSFLPAY